MIYEVMYDYCSDDGYYEERGIVENFEGTHVELQEHIKNLKENNCYNISACEVGHTESEVIEDEQN